MLFKTKRHNPDVASQKPGPRPTAQAPSIRLKPGYEPIGGSPIRLAVFSELVRRWDREFPNWRHWKGQRGEDMVRPASLIAFAAEPSERGGGRNYVGLVDVVNSSTTLLTDENKTIVFDLNSGKPQFDQQILDYFASGGFMLTVAHVSAGQIDNSAISPLDREASHLDVFVDISTDELAGRLRLLKFLLLQLGQIHYVDRRGEDRSTILEQIKICWHPFFAWHVDIWRQLTAGADRFRYTSHDFPRLGLQRLEAGLAELHALGIFSMPILCSED